MKHILIHIPKTGGTSVVDVLKEIDPNFIIPHRKHDRHYTQTKGVTKHFTFSIVRNPWDRLLSFYFWHRDGGGRALHDESVDFTGFVKNLDEYFNLTDPEIPTSKIDPGDERIMWRDKSDDQYTWLISPKDDSLIVDHLIRFENLQSGFDGLCKKLELPQTDLPIRNQTEHDHYTKYYNNETIEIVRKRYNRDIKRFNYEYGQ